MTAFLASVATDKLHSKPKGHDLLIKNKSQKWGRKYQIVYACQQK